MKALELANWAALQCDPGPQAAAELRRLAEVNEELLGALEDLVRVNDEHNADWIAVIGRPAGWNDVYLDKSRAAISKAKEQQ